MLGWVWFDLLFGRRYRIVLGRDHLADTKLTAYHIGGPSIWMLVTTLASAVLMRWLSSSALGAAIGFGALIGFGLLGATAVNMAINPRIPRPLAYGFLSASYFALASVIVAVVLVLVG
jgi:hypothetical protein